jgi:hypothetical protein
MRGDFTLKSALALEPFTMVGAVVVERLFWPFPGQMAAHQSGSRSIGAFGFFGGVREVIRRLNPNSSSADDR